jgi:diphthamide biosynthesis methyltransferase
MIWSLFPALTPYIHAVRVFNGKTYSQSYKIISLGQYPTKAIYTRKEKGINYKILNNYQIEITLNGLVVLCKTQYQFSRKIAVNYIVEWVDKNNQIKLIHSSSSAGAAGSLFLKVNLKFFFYFLIISLKSCLNLSN